MDASNLDMLAMMAFLRDAPAIGVHVPGRPDITGASLQRGIRFMFNRVPLNLPKLPPLVDVTPIAVKPVKVKTTRGKRTAVPGSAAQWIAAVRTVLRASDTRNTIPILACVRITVKAGVATLNATDMERAITYTLETSAPDLDCVTNGKALLAALKAMPGDATVELIKHADTPDTKRKVAAVEAGPFRPAVPEHEVTVPGIPGALQVGRTKLGTMALADFPSLKMGDAVHSFMLTTEDAARLFGKVEHAISTEETRYCLNGVYLHTRNGRLRTVTTDGHRLAMWSVYTPDGADKLEGTIVPRATVSDLLAILQPGGAVSVKVSDTRVAFESGPVRIVSKLIKGTFPEYERVIPSEDQCEHTVTLGRDSFIASVKAAQAVLPKGCTQAVKVTASSELGTVTVSASNVETGSQACEEVRTCYGCSVDIEVGYNSRYLLDILSQVEGSLVFQWNDRGSPCRILDSANPDYLSVLMPIRI